jgi:hypothetical protein
MRQPKPPRGGLRQRLEQRLPLRPRAVPSGAPVVAPWAAPFLQGQGPPPQAVGGREGRSTGNGQQELARSQAVDETRGSLDSRLPGAVLPRVALVPHRLPGPEAALLAPAVEPFVEGLPSQTGRFPGAQAPLPPGGVPGGLERLCKAPQALTGRGTCELTTTHGGLRPQTSTVVGFAHIDSHGEQGRVVSICLPSPGTRLLVGE